MKGDEPQPRRKPVILIGAPSGAGKTVLSQMIMEGVLPYITNLYEGCEAVIPVRHDAKALPVDLPCDDVLIIECATHKLEQFRRTDQWKRMLAVVHESELVIHITLDVPRRTVVRQYFFRIFTGPKRMSVFYRVLQLSKYRNTLIYMLTRQLSRSNSLWERFGRHLAAEMPQRVILVRARRRGADLHFVKGASAV